MRFGTKAVHFGVKPDPSTGAIMTPIFQTSTFVQEGIGKHKGFEYSRTGNPTREVLEKSLAGLENAKHGLAYASGLAAEFNVLSLLKRASHVISVDDVYGGTYRLFKQVMEKYGLEFDFFDFSQSLNLSGLIKNNTKMVWIETPTNPLLKIVDIKETARITKENGLILVVDNTFASPCFQNPLDLGADIVVHSTTKYINGHSDVIGGAVMLNNKKLFEELKFLQNAIGAVPGPFDSFLTLRGIKTFSLRMKQHQRNAFEVAGFLSNHPKIGKVIYPGLESHPQHSIARKQMSGFSGMVSFELKGSLKEVKEFLSKLKVIALAESLGGVESLIEHPALMTHSSIPEKERKQKGIKDNLLRLSIGIEGAQDLINDLNQALGF